MQTKPTSPLIETFAIQLPSGRYYNDSISVGNSTTASLIHAVKFQSINTAIQFNRIINGRIITLFNGV